MRYSVYGDFLSIFRHQLLRFISSEINRSSIVGKGKSGNGDCRKQEQESEGVHGFRQESGL